MIPFPARILGDSRTCNSSSQESGPSDNHTHTSKNKKGEESHRDSSTDKGGCSHTQSPVFTLGTASPSPQVVKGEDFLPNSELSWIQVARSQNRTRFQGDRLPSENPGTHIQSEIAVRTSRAQRGTQLFAEQFCGGGAMTKKSLGFSGVQKVKGCRCRLQLGGSITPLGLPEFSRRKRSA